MFEIKSQLKINRTLNSSDNCGFLSFSNAKRRQKNEKDDNQFNELLKQINKMRSSPTKRHTQGEKKLFVVINLFIFRDARGW